MIRIASAFILTAVLAAPAFAGGKDAMFFPNGKPVTAESQQKAPKPAPVITKAKYKPVTGKAAPVPQPQ